MPPESHRLLESAWRSLWKAGGPHAASAALESGLAAAGIAPLGPLYFPDTGPVILFHREPWGGVSLSLHGGAVGNLGSIAGGDLRYDEARQEVSATVTFAQLVYSGRYAVKSHPVAGSAIETAGMGLKLLPGDQDDGNLGLAKSYQGELMQTNNGQFMVGTYYTFNDAYDAIFQVPSMATQWKLTTTGGENQNTAFFAQQTSNAAQPANRGTMSVNGTPNNQGYTDYNFHSFTMQGLVVGTCQYLAGKQTDPALKQHYLDAATAATSFKGSTQNPSQKSQTVNDVLTIVQTSPPPDQADLLRAAVTEEPEWMQRVHERVERMMAPIRDDIDNGRTLQDIGRALVRGTFESRFTPQALTLTGRVEPDGPQGRPTVRFTALAGAPPKVPLHLSPFADPLYTEVLQALERAEFLKDVLGRKVASALAGEKVLAHLSRTMNLALSQRLATLGS
jgi:hypothetical protein